MKSKFVIPAVAVVWALFSVQADAADSEAKDKNAGTTRPAGVATFGQLDELRSQNALLEASIKNAELRSKLAGGKATSAPGAASLLSSPQAAQAPVQPAPMANADASPTVASAEVEMVASDADGRLVAVLVLQNGRKIKARVGMDVPGLGVVKSISIDEVVAVGKKGKLVTIPFANEPTMGSYSGGNASPMMPVPGNMPGLSTVMPPIPAQMRGGR